MRESVSKWREHLLSIMLVGAVAVCRWAVPASTQQLPRTVAIIPGRSIGLVWIGMPIDEAKAIAIQFSPVEENSNEKFHGFCNTHHGVGFCVYDYVRTLGYNLRNPGHVVFIVTDDNRFRLTSDLRVGSAFAGFLKMFGIYTASSGAIVKWESLGLSVLLNTQNSVLLTVGSIAVFQPVVEQDRP